MSNYESSKAPKKKTAKKRPEKKATKKTAKKAAKKAAKSKGGRPSSYTPEIGDIICARLACAESMRTICKDDDMPSRVTVFKWLRTYPEFLSQYARAKEESADAMMEEIIDIADDGMNDWMEVFDKEGESVGWRLNGEHVQRSKLRIDSRKWLMSKMKPKKYGEKLELESKSKTEMVIPDEVQDRLVAAMQHAANIEAPAAFKETDEQ